MYYGNMKIRELVSSMAQKLIPVCPHPNSAEQEAWWLVEKLLKKSRTALMLAREIELTPEQSLKLSQWVVQRTQQRKPLQYILGSVPFCGLDILVHPPTLIPRPETEEWTSWLIAQLQPLKNEKLEILDLCSGSGCIALALAQALPNSRVTGIDLSGDAVHLSRENKKHTKTENVTFLESDLFEDIDLEARFDLIVSNPPYIDEAQYKSLGEEVLFWEDKNALVAKNKGLAVYERIIAQAAGFLNSRSPIASGNIPQIVFEIGYEQGAAVASLLQKAQFTNVTVHKDLEQKDRWVTARLA